MENYTKGIVLGTGTFGKVLMATHKEVSPLPRPPNTQRTQYLHAHTGAQCFEAPPTVATILPLPPPLLADR